MPVAVDEKAIEETVARLREQRPPPEGWTRDQNKAWLEMVHAQLGVAKQPMAYAYLPTPVVQTAYECIRAANDELGHPGLQLTGVCLEAIFDGYVLGGVLSPPSGEPQRTFKRGADITRFQKTSAHHGPALSAALGPLLERLIAPWMKEVAPELVEDGAAALRNAVGAGLLLHQFEHAAKHPVLDALKATAKAKRASRPVDALPVTAPPNPAMMAAILAAPDDDTPRLVYADWLTEQGDPRGEFIRLQCTLGRTLIGAGAKWGSGSAMKPAESKEPKERETQLVKRHEKEWLGARCYRQWRWQRGFVVHVVADARTFARGLTSLAQVPLESAQLTGYKHDCLADFQALEPHPTLRRLNLSQNRLGPKTMELLTTPLFDRAVTLDLWGNDFSSKSAVEALAKVPLQKLTRLSVSMTDLTVDGVAALVEAPFFARLSHLSLAHNRELDRAALRKVLEHGRALQWLDVSFGVTDQAMVNELVEHAPKGLTQLQHHRGLAPQLAQQLSKRFTEGPAWEQLE